MSDKITRRAALYLVTLGTAACITPDPKPRPRLRRFRTRKGPPLTPQPMPPTTEVPALGATLQRTEPEWKQALTPRQFEILRQRGTEPAWTGAYLRIKQPGVYHCAACNAPVFDARTKYDSKTGWPSFWDVVDPKRVRLVPDKRLDPVRLEVFCAHCGGHLGHVFDDGPKPTGKRYCVNSMSLYFRPQATTGAQKP